MVGPSIPPLDDAVAALAASASHQVAESDQGSTEAVAEDADLDNVHVYALRRSESGGLHMGHVSHSSHSSGGGGHFSGHVSHSSHVSGAHSSHFSSAPSAPASPRPTHHPV